VIVAWIKGLYQTRFGRIAGFVSGLAMTVALLACLGMFLHESAASMTARSIGTVPVDWQVELVPGAAPDAIREVVDQAARIDHVEPAAYAQVDGFEFGTDTVQATGPGKALGLDPGYASAFPGGFRLLSGNTDGAVLLQQTAANLHAGPGDTILLHRPGLTDATTRVSGVVDLLTADTMFQAIGVPAGAAPQAPPDNAVFLPMAEWKRLFDPQAAVRPDSVRRQLYIRLDHTVLSSDPGNAYLQVLQAGNNLEARVAGSALLANNLAARLDAARGDALYARVLFLFLGAPGIVLGALMTIAVATSASDRRRRDQSLLRLRGAPISVILAFAAAEALAMGVGGVLIGLAIAECIVRWLLQSSLVSPSGAPWLVFATLCGLGLALAAILVPAWHMARHLSVVAARQSLGAMRKPIWRVIGLDFILPAIGVIVFWRTAATGYQIILATEGVAATSVDYTAFLAPVLVWAGAGLLTLRLADWCLDKGRAVFALVLSPFAGAVSGAVAASLARQRRRIAAGIALTALAFAFASSTAIFNTTYQGQARVDAELTNGADVTITGSTSAPAGPALGALAKIPGVVGIAPMQHRYAYVGNDLQDIYRIDPTGIGSATTLSNAFFQGGDAAAAMAKLAATPSAVLVSEETVTDFQLKEGDPIQLRLQGPDHQYHVVPFIFAGVVREFPTAPHDSFLVANASYVAGATGVDAREIVLLRTSGDKEAVKNAAIAVTKAMPGVRVTSLADAAHLIGSSLTAVDLSGLTHIELGFAVLIVAGETGLVLALGLADRRRSFAILTVLGAKPKELAAFIWSEGGIILIAGVLIGTMVGVLIAAILVTVLSGVFDPPPERLSIPWLYLIITLIIATAATLFAIFNALRETRVDPIQRLRELQ
jgi:putative ABC transport system permease protein